MSNAHNSNSETVGVFIFAIVQSCQLLYRFWFRKRSLVAVFTFGHTDSEVANDVTNRRDLWWGWGTAAKRQPQTLDNPQFLKILYDVDDDDFQMRLLGIQITGAAVH